MKHTTIELRKIIAEDGYILTNGEAYGKEVYLGKNDYPGNWHEITEEEYNKILLEEKKKMEEELK